MVILGPVMTHYVKRHGLEMFSWSQPPLSWNAPTDINPTIPPQQPTSASNDGVRLRLKKKGITIRDPFNSPQTATKLHSIRKRKEKIIISNEENDDNTNKFNDDYFTDI